jgi:hypothetical protein
LRSRLHLATTICTCFLFLTAGCGGSKGEDPSSAVIARQAKQYYTALERGDGNLACRLLTAEAAESFEAVITGRVSRKCEANIETVSRRSGLRGIPEVTRVERMGDQATAHLVFEDPLFETDVVLLRKGGTWRFAQLPAVVEAGIGDAGTER